MSEVTRYVTEKIKFLPLSNRNFIDFPIHSFKIASRYPNIIAVVKLIHRWKRDIGGRGSKKLFFSVRYLLNNP